MRSGVPEYVIEVPSNRGIPQLPFEIVGSANPLISRSDTRMSLAPTPQFAPTASGCTGRSVNTDSSAPGWRPIIVRPAVSNDMVHT